MWWSTNRLQLLNGAQAVPRDKKSILRDAIIRLLGEFTSALDDSEVRRITSIPNLKNIGADHVIFVEPSAAEDFIVTVATRARCLLLLTTCLCSLISFQDIITFYPDASYNTLSEAEPVLEAERTCGTVPYILSEPRRSLLLQSIVKLRTLLRVRPAYIRPRSASRTELAELDESQEYCDYGISETLDQLETLQDVVTGEQMYLRGDSFARCQGATQKAGGPCEGFAR